MQKQWLLTVIINNWNPKCNQYIDGRLCISTRLQWGSVSCCSWSDSEPRDDVQKLSPYDIYGPYLFINTT